MAAEFWLSDGVELRVKRNSSAAGGNPGDVARQVQFLLSKDDPAADGRKLVTLDKRSLGRQGPKLDRNRHSIRLDGRRHQDMRSAPSPVLGDSTFVHEALHIGFG